MNMFLEPHWLKAFENVGYGALPLPCSRDNQISDVIGRWMALDEYERQMEAKMISPDQQPVLRAFSERMASLAVRRSDIKLIVLGIVALGLDGWRGDWRENVMLLSLHYDATKRIGCSAAKVFGDASSLLSERVSASIDAFASRSSEDQSIEAMGYRVDADPDGFRYRRIW